MHLRKLYLIYESFSKTSVLEKIYYDIQNIIDMLDISNEIYHFLHNNFLNSEKKWFFLYLIFHFENCSSTIIKLIQFTNWEKKKGITYSLMNLWNRKKKLVKISVITAKPLSNPLIEEYILKIVKKSNNNRKFFLEKKVNNSIIGGLILSIEDKEWDNSLEESFRRLRNQ